jgi:hypothetical protein
VTTTYPRAMVILLAVAMAAGLGLAIGRWQPAHAQAPAADKAASTSPHYSVVETEATNLIAIDNRTNTLYFYTVDPGMAPGSDLKLRGTLDLNQVGKPVLKPTKTKADK